MFMDIENKYTKKEWDTYYEKERALHIRPKKYGIFSSYDIFLFQTLLKKYLPFYNGSENNKPKICEIGCGDGKLVRELADLFNYEAWGVEYSEAGIIQTNNRNVKTIFGDAFDQQLISAYRQSFDIVYSYGFVEHIIPPEKAVAVHLELLKPGGYFFIQIPRLKKFNYWKVKIFRPELIPLHNLEIMEEKKLRIACTRTDVEELFCKNYGTFKLRVPMDKKNFRYYLLKAICLSEYILNPLIKLSFNTKGFETRLLSPSILFIGKKR